MTFIEIKQLAEQWCEEAGVDISESWHHPYRPEVETSIALVLWSLHTERYMSVQGMKLHFDRFVNAVQQRQNAAVTA